MSRLSPIIFVFAVVLMASCNFPGKQEQLVPEERMLSSDVMENIFYEMHVADAMVSLHIVQVDGHTSLTPYKVDSLIYESIYDKYGCTRESFEESILWYIENNIEELRTIYDNVVERFNQNLAGVGKNPSDSLSEEEGNTL